MSKILRVSYVVEGTTDFIVLDALIEKFLVVSITFRDRSNRLLQSIPTIRVFWAAVGKEY